MKNNVTLNPDDLVPAGEVVSFVATVGNHRVNAFMKACDLSHDKKAFATDQRFTGKSDGSKTLREILNAVREKIESQYLLVSIQINCGELSLSWRNENITEVSDGKYIREN